MPAQPSRQYVSNLEWIVSRVTAHLHRLDADGDIGTIVVHCGADQISVECQPKRKEDPVPRTLLPREQP